MPTLCKGGFVDQAENILCFGLPGRGKTHLVQRLLVAKKGLALEAELRKLDRLDAVIVDDIGYIQQSRDEMEVLFTFIGSVARMSLIK